MNNSREQLLLAMGPAMKCTIFDKDIDVTSFSHKQLQVSVLPKDKINLTWSKREVEYTCKFEKQDNYDNTKPTAIIPIRDCSNIITMCMESMKKSNTFELINVIIVDDRSTEDIKSIADDYGVSYLRVDYDSTFNFSMLCNLAAKVCYDLGNSQVIMWNADLYIADRVNLERLLEKHNEKKSSISGAKLLYPPLKYSTCNEEDTQNILTHFPNMAGRWRGTIQFGGDVWIKTSGPIKLSPDHAFRFTNDKQANIDRESSFVTGALQVIQVKDFIDVGGYNPSLEKNFQDVDVCLALKNAWFFGKDIEFYHDESPVFSAHNNKLSNQLISDHTLYGLLNNE